MIFNSQIFAGCTWNFTKSFSDYPADEWDCEFTLKKDSTNSIVIDAAADGTGFIFSAAADDSEDLEGGTYKYQFKFTNKTTSEVQVITGYDTVEALLENITDIRTHNRIMLEALTDVLKGRATKEVLNMSYKGKSFQLLSLKELREAKEYYEAQCELEENEEKIKNGENTGNKLLIGFTRNS